jgi:hypothetical protein
VEKRQALHLLSFSFFSSTELMPYRREESVERDKKLLDVIKDMRERLDDAERRIKKKQKWSAYKQLNVLRGQAYWCVGEMAQESIKCAMDFGSAISIRDENGKHKEFAIMSNR